MNIESYATIDESAKIQGVALIPRISRNNNLYTKEELVRFNGVTVPLNWEHNPDKVIGEVTFQYDSTSETVFYEGEITDPSAALLAANKLLYTSIEATPTNVQKICNGSTDCFHMPFGLVPEGLALTETPGVPETSVNVLKESVIQTINQCKEHTDADHEFVKKYGAEEIIHKTIKPREKEAVGGEQTVDNIIQDNMAQHIEEIEGQIKMKNEALELFKQIQDNNEDPLLHDTIAILQNDIEFLTSELLLLRKDSEFVSVESKTRDIIENIKHNYFCGHCNEVKKKNK